MFYFYPKFSTTMNKMIMTALAAVLSLSAFSQKVIETKITDVTVFLAGAQITHHSDVNIKAGENTFRVINLPLYMDPNSIQVEGNSNYTILSVRHQVNYLNDQTSNPRVKAIEDSLEEAQFKLQEIAGLRNVAEQERMMLEANRSIKGANAVLLTEDLEEMANFYKNRFKELSYRNLELTQQERRTNEEIQRLQNQLQSLNARKGANPGEILVTISATKESKTSLNFSYVSQSAGWAPVYDLRAEDINSPIEFAYRAKVYQSTGTDWNKVNLTISTGNPNVGGQIPTMAPWYISIYDPQPVSYNWGAKGKAEQAPQAQMAYDSVANGAYAIEQDKEERVYTTADYTSVSSNTVNTEFKISIPYDIPSDNQQYDVVMQKQSLKANYNYIAIPKLDNDAFLRAQITDWMQYALLAGESNIYFKGTFVGKGYIDPAAANDTLDLSLGRDKSITVKREQIKDFCKTSSFGSKQKTTKAYEITITNTKKSAVNLTIEDQLPISNNGDLEVETEEISGGTLDAQSNKISWKLTVQPGETIKKQLRFSVSYPKKKYISGL
jgi:uncharacterized protein (TIGR02231 family)